MSIRVTCPECGNRYELPEVLRGKRVRCKNCETQITVPTKNARASKASGDDDLEEVTAAPDEGSIRTARTPPRPPRRSRRDDDADDAPRPRRRPRQEPEELKEPVGLMIAGVVAAAIVIIGGLGFAVWFFVLRTPKPKSTEVQGVVAQVEPANQPVEINRPVEPVAPFPPVVQPGPVPFNLPVEPPAGDAVTKALADLQSPDLFRCKGAIHRLIATPPNDRRDEVARALAPLTEHKDVFVRQGAVKALATWGTHDSVPALIRAINHPDVFTRWAAMGAVAPLKDERAAEAVAGRLTDFGDRGVASKALQAMGSTAEAAVVARLGHADDGVRKEACLILKVIHTAASVPALQAAARDPNVWVAQAAREALQGAPNPPNQGGVPVLPVPGPAEPVYGPEESVRLCIHVTDLNAWPAFAQKLKSAADSPNPSLKVNVTSGEYRWVTLAPVRGDLDNVARKLNFFGVIGAIHNNQRLIYVDPR